MASLQNCLTLSCLAFLHIGFALGVNMWNKGEDLPKISPKSESCLGCASLTGSQFRRCLERHCTPSISHSSILPNINGKCSLLVNLAKDECDMEFDKVSNFLEPNRMKTLLPPAKRIWGDPLEVCIGTRCNGMMGNIRRMCIINRCYNTK